jgi:hypothetical protein
MTVKGPSATPRKRRVGLGGSLGATTHVIRAGFVARQWLGGPLRTHRQELSRKRDRPALRELLDRWPFETASP